MEPDENLVMTEHVMLDIMERVFNAGEPCNAGILQDWVPTHKSEASGGGKVSSSS